MKALCVLAQNLEFQQIGATSSPLSFDGASLLTLITAEDSDDLGDFRSIATRVRRIFSETVGGQNTPSSLRCLQRIILMPFAHLSEFAATDLEKVDTAILSVAEMLRPHVSAHVVPRGTTPAILARMALFDTVASSHLCSTRNTLKHHIASLARIFSREALQECLDDAYEEVQHD